jgi:hypothetical protein
MRAAGHPSGGFLLINFADEGREIMRLTDVACRLPSAFQTGCPMPSSTLRHPSATAAPRKVKAA